MDLRTLASHALSPWTQLGADTLVNLLQPQVNGFLQDINEDRERGRELQLGRGAHSSNPVLFTPSKLLSSECSNWLLTAPLPMLIFAGYLTDKE